MLAEVTLDMVTVEPEQDVDGTDIAPGLFAVEFTVMVAVVLHPPETV